jgi:hypothetical protein
MSKNGASVVVCKNIETELDSTGFAADAAPSGSFVQHYFNRNYLSTLLDREWPDLGITSASVEFVPGFRLICRYKRRNVYEASSDYFGLRENSTFYMIVAIGTTNGLEMLSYHFSARAVSMPLLLAPPRTTRPTTTAATSSSTTKLPAITTSRRTNIATSITTNKTVANATTITSRYATSPTRSLTTNRQTTNTATTRVNSTSTTTSSSPNATTSRGSSTVRPAVGSWLTTTNRLTSIALLSSLSNVSSSFTDMVSKIGELFSYLVSFLRKLLDWD